MNNNPLVSIIVNCFNSEKYLHQTLQSIIDQTYQNWEVILWDNNSTDNSKNIVLSFKEKPQASSGWINGGFFVFNKKIIKLIKNDQIMLEREPLENLARKKQLLAFKHKGFWQCMDSKKDLDLLNSICKKNNIPWIKI